MRVSTLILCWGAILLVGCGSRAAIPTTDSVRPQQSTHAASVALCFRETGSDSLQRIVVNQDQDRSLRPDRAHPAGVGYPSARKHGPSEWFTIRGEQYTQASALRFIPTQLLERIGEHEGVTLFVDEFYSGEPTPELMYWLNEECLFVALRTGAGSR